MRKSRKNIKKNKTKKCIYTDEAKRVLQRIHYLRKKNKTRNKKNT